MISLKTAHSRTPSHIPLLALTTGERGSTYHVANDSDTRNPGLCDRPKVGFAFQPGRSWLMVVVVVESVLRLVHERMRDF
jgi:hypothetical protein